MKIKVLSPSFSRNETLVSELKSSFGDVTVNSTGKRLKGDELSEFIGEADGVIAGLEPIDESVLSKCRELRIISKFGVGLDGLDLDALEKHNITLGWTPGVNKRSVSEMTLGYMLTMLRNMYRSSLLLKNGQWQKNGGMQLTGRKIGIIGLGNIGKDLVSLLKPFDCTILANDIIDISDFCRVNDIQEATKGEIYTHCDVITVHTPLTDLTRDMINAETLAMMKESTIVVNSARGGIVDLPALYTALRTGKIAGAAIDVYDTEPPESTEIRDLDNLFCTPHIGGNAAEAVLAMGRSAIEHLVRFKSEN